MLSSQDFSSTDGFLDAISSAWHREWQRVYSTDRRDTVPFKDGGVDYQVVYTPSIKLWSVVTQGECVTSCVCAPCDSAQMGCSLHSQSAPWPACPPTCCRTFPPSRTHVVRIMHRAEAVQTEALRTGSVLDAPQHLQGDGRHRVIDADAELDTDVAALTGGSFLCLLATLYWTVRAVSWLGSLLGPARTPLATVLAAWCAASAWLATRDVRPPLLPPQQETAQQNGTAPAVAPNSSTDNLAGAAKVL